MKEYIELIKYKFENTDKRFASICKYMVKCYRLFIVYTRFLLFLIPQYQHKTVFYNTLYFSNFTFD